ncbi:MAG: hypothetical protein U5O15_01510 [Candidatus Krumholzibacteriota bacterium]|nr:hypothetical protein [Candidatus Krumholzibacteriota bacterium]
MRLIDIFKTLRRASGQGFLARRGRKSEPEVGVAIPSPGELTTILKISISRILLQIIDYLIGYKNWGSFNNREYLTDILSKDMIFSKGDH